MKKIIGLAIIIAFIVAYVPIISLSASVTYYVSLSGSDSNNGLTIDAPFKTIQKAASAMTAGDTCFIRGGTYRETVTPLGVGTAANKIVFKNYNNEPVTISGADMVTNWTQHTGSIYKTSANLTLDDANQVFTFGQMINEARWPNNTGSLLNPTLATPTYAYGTNINDSNLTQASGFWNGAKIWCLGVSENMYWATTSKVASFANNSLTVERFKKQTSDIYAAESLYYLSGVLNALDTENEWYYSKQDQMLYLWAAGGLNPNTILVEGKKRDYGFILDGKSNISIEGINLFSCGISTDMNTNNCTIDSMTAQYVMHKSQNGGINLNGTSNTFKNSTVSFSSSTIVSVTGTSNNLVNCLIEYGGYDVTENPAVYVAGKYHLISNNTIHDTGRDGLGMGASEKCEIQYNEIYNAGMLSKDKGCFYIANVYGGNTRIHHNIVRDIGQRLSDGSDIGIYLDNYSSGFIIDHNVVYNCPLAIQCNTPSNYNMIANNTLVSTDRSYGYWGNQFGSDTYGNILANNIYTNFEVLGGGSISKNNIMSTTTPQFNNTSANDFTLMSISPAIDAGIEIQGITDGFSGNYPDCGAYEYGQPKWVAGHSFASPLPNPVYNYVNVGGANLVKNAGFELSCLEFWNTTGVGRARLLDGSAWDNTQSYAAREGYHRLRLGGGGDGVEQEITGLKPDTYYTFSVWVKSDFNAKSTVGVRGNDGRIVTSTNTQLAWKQLTVDFKTKPDETSAVVFIVKEVDTQGYVYCDLAGFFEKDISMLGDSFENGMSGWSALYTDLAITSEKSHSGNKSSIVSGSRKVVGKDLGGRYNKVASLWIYDDISNTNVNFMARADLYNNYNENAGTLVRGLGINTDVSQTNYVYSMNGNILPTNIKRTTGWHEFRFDYSSGKPTYSFSYRADLYIDGEIAISSVSKIPYNLSNVTDYGIRYIAFGNWSETESQKVYVDDFEIYDFDRYSDTNAENGFAGWNSQNAPVFSVDYKHSGQRSYKLLNDGDWYSRSFTGTQNGIVSMWYYDKMVSGGNYCVGRVGMGESWFEIGVKADVSSDKYCIIYGGNSVVTNSSRRSGWHQYKWDFSSGNDVKAYIDGDLVQTVQSNGFNEVWFLDKSSDGIKIDNYFDDIVIKGIDYSFPPVVERSYNNTYHKNEEAQNPNNYPNGTNAVGSNGLAVYYGGVTAATDPVVFYDGGVKLSKSNIASTDVRVMKTIPQISSGRVVYEFDAIYPDFLGSFYSNRFLRLSNNGSDSNNLFNIFAGGGEIYTSYNGSTVYFSKSSDTSPIAHHYVYIIDYDKKIFNIMIDDNYVQNSGGIDFQFPANVQNPIINTLEYQVAASTATALASNLEVTIKNIKVYTQISKNILDVKMQTNNVWATLDYTSPNATNAVLMLGVYDANGKLVEIIKKDASNLSANLRNTVATNMTSSRIGGYTYKAFAWQGFENAKPLISSTVK